MNVLQKLEKSGKTFGYVSNNSTVTVEKFAKRLCSMGINASIQNVILPTTAIISYLKSINFKKKVCIIALSGMKREFLDAGFQLAESEVRSSF